MDISKIRKLIKMVKASDIAEIEVVEGTHSVRISRAVATATITPEPVQATVQPAVSEAMVSEEAAVTESSPHQVAGHAPNDEHLVTSPMVGTFYRAASPEAEPFVSEGSRVRKGDVLCIIEAMKLMNEIEAEYDGTVQRILVENATPVEYGQAIFEITPA